MAGYSKRTLIEKLGIKSGSKLIFIDPPEGYDRLLGPLPKDTKLESSLIGKFNFIQYFVTSKLDLEKMFLILKKHVSPEGMLWICWPKGGSKIETNLNENVIRKIGLQNALVDVKVCAIDDDWSGLKFIYRLKDRK